jgi:glycosyltransferase involved in cell wall biosynthesis
MKILLLSHKFYPDIGGIEVNSELLATSFSLAKHEIHVLTWSEDPTSRVFPFLVVRKPNLRKLLSEHAWADVILENNPCLRLSWPGILYHKTSVVVLNTWISRMDGSLAFQDVLKLLWLKRASKVIAVSRVLRDGSFKAAIVIGNPYRAAELKILDGIRRDKDFVFLGRLVSDKGADLALKAFEKVLRFTAVDNGRHKPVTLTIIGDGPDMNSLKALATRLKVADNVTFTGSLTGQRLVTALNQHKFMIVPSMWKEPFGNVALEGMACGCLPIVADGGGLPDAIGNAGMVFKRGELSSLVKVISKLLNNTKLVRELNLKAHNHLQNHHPDVVSQKYLRVITDVTPKSTISRRFSTSGLWKS